MPNLANQKVMVADLAREAGAQRAQLNDAWSSLCASRSAVVTTIKVAVAAADAAPLFSAIYRLTFGRSQCRGRYLRTLIRRVFERE